MESLTKSASRLLAEPYLNGTGRPSLRPVGILGVGSHAPARVIGNQELERIVETTDEWIVSRTGIRQRHIAAPGETTYGLGVEAGRRALLQAGIEPEELDLVIVATVTPDYPFPATASLVQHHVGATRAAAFDLGAACSGFIYALAVATQFVQTGFYRRILVVGAERISRIVNWTDRGTCVLFGDGAGAAVVGPVAAGAGFFSFDLGSDGSGAELLVVKGGGQGHPEVTGGDGALPESIRMSGSEVFKFAVRVMDESTRRVLDRAGLQISDVDLLVPHQANSRIIEAAAKRLGMPQERVFSNVDQYGNTSAASIPIALAEAVEQERLRPGHTLALVGFGAGLSWAASVLRWTGPEGAA